MSQKRLNPFQIRAELYPTNQSEDLKTAPAHQATSSYFPKELNAENGKNTQKPISNKILEEDS